MRHLWIILGIAAAVFFTYLWSVNGVFQFDDYRSIVENKHLAGDRIEHVVGYEQARPVLMLSLWASYKMGGTGANEDEPDPESFHWWNITVHVLATILVYLLVHQTVVLLGGAWDKGRGKWPIPLIAAVVFGVHPLQTEAVTYLVSRSTSMCTLFMLAGLCCFIRFRIKMDAVALFKGKMRWLWAGLPYVSAAGLAGALLTIFHQGSDPSRHIVANLIRAYSPAVYDWFARKPEKTLVIFDWLGWLMLMPALAVWVIALYRWNERRRSDASTTRAWAYHMSAMLFFVLAMGTKEVAIITVPLLIVYDRLILHRRLSAPPGGVLLGYAPFALQTLLAVIVWFVLFGGIAGETAYSAGEYFRVQGVAVWKYAGMFLFPFGQSVDHTLPLSMRVIPPAGIWLAGYGLMAGLMALAIYRARRAPAVSLCIFWFFLAVAPTSWFKIFLDPFSERHAYAAMPALCLLLALGLFHPFRPGAISRGAAWLRTVSVTSAVVIAISFAAMTVRQNERYKSLPGIWRNVAEYNPTSARVMRGIGFGMIKTMDSQRTDSSYGLDVTLRSYRESHQEADGEKLRRMFRLSHDAYRQSDLVLRASYHLEGDLGWLSDTMNNIAIVNGYLTRLEYQKAEFEGRGSRSDGGGEDEASHVRDAYNFWGRSIGLKPDHFKSLKNCAQFMAAAGKAQYESIKNDLGPNMSSMTEAVARLSMEYLVAAEQLDWFAWHQGEMETDKFERLAGSCYTLGRLSTESRRHVGQEDRLRAYHYFFKTVSAYASYDPSPDKLADARRTVSDAMDRFLKVQRLLLQSGRITGKEILRLRVPGWYGGNQGDSGGR